MAKAKTQSTPKRIEKPKVRRKGVHSKKRSSGLKSSKNYIKLSVGQG
jgi:hypothetical protein